MYILEISIAFYLVLSTRCIEMLLVRVNAKLLTVLYRTNLDVRLAWKSKGIKW